jgi:acetyl esterase/lipase
MSRPIAILQTALALCLAAGSAQAQAPAPTEPLSWEQLSKLPSPIKDVRFAYGKGEPAQTAELRMPSGRGPFPVVVLVHGGCWQSPYDYEYMTRLADWFEKKGLATWTIGYRRLGDAGGGWPGTFADVADATDHLRFIAKTHDLDLRHVYAVGHSAGGQLALWLASREQLSAKSELYREHPIPILGVIGIDAITDLAAYRAGPPDSCHASVDKLLGDPERFPRRYAETSPRQRLPLEVPQAFVHGGRDPIVPPASAQAYVEAAQKAGDRVKWLPVPAAGHFEATIPDAQSEAAMSEAWSFISGSAR